MPRNRPGPDDSAFPNKACPCGYDHIVKDFGFHARQCQTCWRRGLPCIEWNIRAARYHCFDCKQKHAAALEAELAARTPAPVKPAGPQLSLLDLDLTAPAPTPTASTSGSSSTREPRIPKPESCAMHISSGCTDVADHLPDYVDLFCTACNPCYALACQQLDDERAALKSRTNP